MTAPANLHTHTTFCDGKNTPEEIINEAIRLGCKSIGFSGHSYIAFDTECCMSLENTKKYMETLIELREKYAEKIKVIIGIEQDYYSEMPTEGYDYVIGSVHYVRKNGKYYAVDDTAEASVKAVKEAYNGDWYEYVYDYYQNVADVYNKTKCDIIGHFDLVTKFNEGNKYFDEHSPKYKQIALAALDKLVGCGARVEINYGAIARGYKTVPYPADWLLEEIVKRGFETVKTSDCHDKRFLLLGLTD